MSSSKIPGGKYFGLITVTSEDGISDCIENLNGTEVDGQIIQVERVSFSSVLIVGLVFIVQFLIFMYWALI